MPGFLSEFAGTVIVDAMTGEISEASGTRPQWWVELLKNLPHADHVEADRLLADAMALDIDEDGKDGRVSMRGAGMVAQQEEVLTRSIVSWNLTDENGEVLPVGDRFGVQDSGKVAAAIAVTRASLARLPEPVILRLKLVAQRQNQPRRGTDAATFPAEPPALDDSARDGRVAERGAGPVDAREVHA